jgi:LPXTG-motif cell wall-anchored protein
MLKGYDPVSGKFTDIIKKVAGRIKQRVKGKSFSVSTPDKVYTVDESGVQKLQRGEFDTNAAQKRVEDFFTNPKNQMIVGGVLVAGIALIVLTKKKKRR